MFQPSLTGTLNLSRTNAFFLGGGKALVNAYYATAQRLGVDVLYDTEVEAIDLDDGFVRKLTVTSKGFPLEVRGEGGRRVVGRVPGQYRVAEAGLGSGCGGIS